MTATARAPIVVGVDGSPSSYRALDWAVAGAQRHAVPLRLVHVVEPVGPDIAITAAATAAGHLAAEETVAKAEAYARAAVPGLEITTEIAYGHVAGRLVEESTRAAVVVVGNRGLGGFRSLLAGSVSVHA